MLESDGPDEGSSFRQLLLKCFGKGLSLGQFWKTLGHVTNLIRNMWKSDGPDRNHHLLNFQQHGLAEDGIGDRFGKSVASDQKTDQE